MPVKKENMGQPPSTYTYKGKTYDLKWWAFRAEDTCDMDPLFLLFGNTMLSAFVYCQMTEA